MNRSDKVTVLTRAGTPGADETTTLSPEAVKLIEDLYLQARDSARGYREAAEAASGGAMKARLFGMARRRNAMAGQLAITMRSLGLRTEHDGTIGETLQRYFDDLKTRLASNDIRGAVGGIIRGEGAFIESMDKALRETLPDAVHGFLERQQRQVRQAMERFSTEITSAERIAKIKRAAVQYRKPALIALGVMAIGAVAAAILLQERRNGTVTRSLASARAALDKALANMPSSRQVRGSLSGIRMPSMPSLNMPRVDMPRFSGLGDLRLPSFLKRG